MVGLTVMACTDEQSVTGSTFFWHSASASFMAVVIVGLLDWNVAAMLQTRSQVALAIRPVTPLYVSCTFWTTTTDVRSVHAAWLSQMRAYTVVLPAGSISDADDTDDDVTSSIAFTCPPAVAL